MKDLFRRAGTVLRADVSLGPDNRSRGYGTVLLATAEDAGRAVDIFNGFSWQTRVLEVRPDRLPPDLDNPLGSVSGPPASSMGNPLTSFLSSPTPGPNLSSSLHKRLDDFDYGSLLSTPDLPGASSSIGRSLFVGNVRITTFGPSRCTNYTGSDIASLSLPVARSEGPLSTSWNNYPSRRCAGS